MDTALQIQTSAGSAPPSSMNTQHLLQVESLFSPISNIEEFYLTDVDLLMGGSPFFPRPHAHP